jgi:phosphomannomutase/phosphoglucomutase
MLLYTFRGIVNKDLTCEVATKIALVEGLRLKNNENTQRILVAGDHRISTAMLRQALTAGFLSVGLDVVDCGTLPTPILSFLVKKLSLPGVMVTASHNPPEWNGFQFHEPDSHIYGPIKEENIKNNLKYDFQLPDWQQIGGISYRSGCIEEYINQLSQMVNIKNPLKVVVDLGGGMASVAVPQLLKSLNIDVIEINSTLDPLFSQRPSEPSPEVIHELRKQVVMENADVGFAYDGDADRVMVVDEEGCVLDSDKLIFILCKEMLKPPGPIVITADVSMVVERRLVEKGFEIIKDRWGQTFIGGSVKQNDAVLGAETNDHYIFPQLSLHADAIAATAFLCSIISRSSQRLSRMFAELPKTDILREKINFTEDLAQRQADIELFLEQHYGSFEKIHERLYLSSQDSSKLLIRQSPFDRFVRIFAESSHPQKVYGMIEQAKKVLIG